ncbi:MAG: arginine--tRNA ligase [Spirulinaceae cyanobacterium SM2_1_0]|nr:arginine--tRNA ligase [Spirulinaceae cyanobacterium SM2_1_0]
MTYPLAVLQQRVRQALVAAFGSDFATYDPLVVPASNPKFGDYQSNDALPLAKRLQQKPRDLAEQILAQLQVSDLCTPPAIAGPGFINFALTPAYLARQLNARRNDPRLGVAPAKQRQRVIVDFSSPNIAKEMHVGHLRSTIIGDSLARVLEFRGHDVLRLNHVGDWGTQFGMLIAYLREVQPAALTTADAVDLGDLVVFYRQAKQRFDADEQFRETARQEVVKLQAGAEDSRRAWQLICAQSRREFQKIYDRLDIDLQERGESFYNPLLPGIVETLERTGLLEENAGAQCVFLDGFQNKDGQPLPLIVKKSDGGFNYATTDLAALQYRIGKDEAERILYVTDAGQANHFTQVFQVARRAGLLTEDVEVVHVPFGLVQGEDGKKLKTRSGETVRLRDLLDEAVAWARADLDKRLVEGDRQESESFSQQVATTVGIAAVKYADLSQNRTSNYIFSFDKMLALQGNTAPYLLYAYARIRSIIRKGAIDLAAQNQPATTRGVQWSVLAIAAGALFAGSAGLYITSRMLHEIGTIPFLAGLLQLVGIGYSLRFGSRNLLRQRDRQAFRQRLQQTRLAVLGEPRPTPRLVGHSTGAIELREEPELVLAKHLLQLDEAIAEVETELLPNRLCQYLFELSQKYNQFYDACPVLSAPEPVRTSRLMLCELTARTLQLGLTLLGIPVLERM